MPKTNGEPPRLRVPRQGTKPLQVVTDDDGQPVLDLPHYLAWHKATGTFYVGGSKPRVYLRTRDRLQAIFRFREWIRANGSDVGDAYVTVFHEPHRHPELSEPVRLVDILDGNRQFVRYDLPTGDFWRLVREAALSDPETFRQETGLRVVDQGMAPSAKLSEILDAYLSKRKKPSDDEIKKVRRYWDFFVAAVAPAKQVQDVDADALTRWEDAAYAKYNNDGSPKTLAHRFEYVQRLFNYAVKKQIDTEECQRVVAAIISAKAELPGLRNLNPNPISVDALHALLDSADKKWKAILLTALNLCYYPVDVRTLPKAAINLKTGVVIFDRAKTGQTTRVGILWKQTRVALRNYMDSQPHDGEEVFITQYGKPYTAQGLRTAFRFLRDKTDVGSSIELAHVRDGAYSAAIEGGATETIAKILAGHKITGMGDAYIKRNPKMVADAVKAIEKHYLRSTPE